MYENVNENVTHLRYADYKAHSFTGKLGFNYAYSKYKIRPVIEFGFAMSFLINSSCTLTEGRYYHITDKTYEGPAEDHTMRGRHYGLYGGIGINYVIRKEQSVFFRVSFDKYSKEDVSQDSWSDYISIMQMKLGYSF